MAARKSPKSRKRSLKKVSLKPVKPLSVNAGLSTGVTRAFAPTGPTQNPMAGWIE
jgi:hypothetical protein